MRAPIDLLEIPNYGLSETAHILRVPAHDIRRWIDDGLVQSSSKGVSFRNLLELHILKALRKESRLPMQRIKRALEEFGQIESVAHPLLDPRLETDGIHLFLHAGTEYLNLNRHRQMGMPDIVSIFLRRIDRHADGGMTYFPFISSESVNDPRAIQMTPNVAFGRPVLANTGISADVIVGRFRARDTIHALAEEYGVSATMIEDCVRWELPQLNAA